jgi:hypothetical protein
MSSNLVNRCLKNVKIATAVYEHFGFSRGRVKSPFLITNVFADKITLRRWQNVFRGLRIDRAYATSSASYLARNWTLMCETLCCWKRRREELTLTSRLLYYGHRAALNVLQAERRMTRANICFLVIDPQKLNRGALAHVAPKNSDICMVNIPCDRNLLQTYICFQGVD